MKGNYWSAGLDIFGEQVESFIPNEIVDVAIIGGGFAGASVFYHLGSRVSSVLIDGHVLAGMDGSSRGPGIVTWLNDISATTEACQYSILNNRMLEKVINDDNIQCRFHRDGHIYLSRLESGIVNIEKTLAMEETGESYVTMNREEVLGGVMSERFAGGVYLPSAFCVNPHLLTNQLVNRVDAGRNRVITGRIVESVTRDDNIFKITLKEEDTIFARKVVYCVGAYTPQLVPETEELFDLKRNICIATKRIGPNMFYSIPRASMSDGYKWFRSTNGRLLAGSVDKFNGEYDSPNVYKKLAKDFYETFPMIEAPIKFNWVSLIASTKSGPIVGPLPNRENEFVSAGYGNSSLSYAFLSGFIVADQIVNGGTDFPYADIFSPEGRLNVV